MDQTVIEMEEKLQTATKFMKNWLEDKHITLQSLENALATSIKVETQALKKVANIRESCIQEVNEHFDEVETRIKSYSEDHILKIKRQILKVKNYIREIEGELKKIEAVLGEKNKDKFQIKSKQVLEKAEETLLVANEPALELAPLQIEVEKEEFSMVLPKVFLKLGENGDSKSELSKEKTSKPLNEIATKTWRLLSTRNLATSNYLIKSIRSNIYCCHTTGITIFNNDLLPVASIPSGVMENVYDVVGFNYRELIVACYKGLFHISQTGTILRRIQEGDYACVAIDGIYVYAANRKGEIQVFDSNDWTVHSVITPKCSSTIHFITLVVWKNLIVSCCIYDNTVRITTTDGLTSHSHGSKGDAIGFLNGPYMCQIDNEGTALIADISNHRLQTVDINGKWTAITDVGTSLRSALYDGQKLYVLDINKNLMAYTCTADN